jgi:hypothetical protein
MLSIEDEEPQCKEGDMPWMPFMEDASSDAEQESSETITTHNRNNESDNSGEPSGSSSAGPASSQLQPSSSAKQQQQQRAGLSNAGIRKYEHEYDGRKIRTTRTAFFELIEGVTLYAFCIFLPAILGVVIKCYEKYMQERADIYSSSADGQGGGLNNNGGASSPLDGDPSSHYLLPGWVYDHCKYWYRLLMAVVCDPKWSPVTNYCTQDAKGYWHGPISSYFAAKASAVAAGVTPSLQLSDLQLMVVLSTCLALLRIVLVHYLVPEVLEEKQLAAMLRCKSMHVLSKASLNSFESPMMKRKRMRLGNSSSSGGEGERGGGDNVETSPPRPPSALTMFASPTEAPMTPTPPVTTPTQFSASTFQRSPSWSPANSE